VLTDAGAILEVAPIFAVTPTDSSAAGVVLAAAPPFALFPADAGAVACPITFVLTGLKLRVFGSVLSTMWFKAFF
jgi:hypothetical protein